MTNNNENANEVLLRFLNEEPISIINLGLEKFANTYKEYGVDVIHVDWKPPVELEEDLSDILDLIG